MKTFEFFDKNIYFFIKIVKFNTKCLFNIVIVDEQRKTVLFDEIICNN
jgi:hypothetical protein